MLKRLIAINKIMVTYSYFRTLAPGTTVTITDNFEPGRVTGILAKQDTTFLDVGFKFRIGSEYITLDYVRFTSSEFTIPLSVKLIDVTPFRIDIINYSALVRNVSITIPLEVV